MQPASAARLRRALAVAALLLPGVAHAADGDYTGRWRTPPEPDGVDSTVELYLQDDHLYGRVLQVRDRNGAEVLRRCERCDGARRGQPLAGMVFIENLHRDGERWIGGRVIDLRPGMTQGVTGTVEISLDHGRAVVYGYKGLHMLGESSTWTRADGD
ncbi:MAG TPA: DUF2147 domain-containing protein [Nevskiaceae bacterium]|nr:DUF2147 domain-containing protein [Nevskiaceae bacterium]